MSCPSLYMRFAWFSRSAAASFVPKIRIEGSVFSILRSPVHEPSGASRSHPPSPLPKGRGPGRGVRFYWEGSWSQSLRKQAFHAPTRVSQRCPGDRTLNTGLLGILGKPETNRSRLRVLRVRLQSFQIMLSGFGRLVQLLGAEIAQSQVRARFVWIVGQQLF